MGPSKQVYRQCRCDHLHQAASRWPTQHPGQRQVVGNIPVVSILPWKISCGRRG